MFVKNISKMFAVTVMASVVLVLASGMAFADDGFTKFEQKCLDGVTTVAHRGYGVGVRAGVAVSARGVNTRSAFRRMKRMGVKFVVTDRPEVVGPMR